MLRIDASTVKTVRDLRAIIEDLDDDMPIELAGARSAGGSYSTEPTNPCWCGCGGLTRRRFCPGHDARFHGLAKRVARGEAPMPETFVNDDARDDFMKWHDRELVQVRIREKVEAARRAAEAEILG